ncbi:unnamed protein product [Sordaria macrospora k-hell]|uniref:WGS project CABT00000000 data, contig 2.37 n=1 Tax=Sordaria macrospora (strain ATCC MYA-333 / DSM 997 / K(L3346) / K-hell) TaxID=771870 RepID=F7W764_SORMK|nr:uncharacterized protein SMAC_06644 [Sordaria macrospora k-hell]KAH7633510.1 hypothetical protein B0T09DRAFT_364023 [Sordaria sp. MPI-SDFR-AT-0083]CCC13355.1 unnamed protein product [Sordaria macrospora k-hell]
MVPILDQSEIPTRFLIISDTYDNVSPHPPASLPNSIDVLIHCGNLTYDSKLAEFTTALALLSSLNTVPLKLIIPGPNDWTLDDAAYEARITEASNTNKKKGGTGALLPRDMEALYAEYGRPGQARQLLLSEKARQHGIFLMANEGRWEFALANHAVLAVGDVQT